MLISQGMVVRIQLDSELESIPEMIASFQILEFCCCVVFSTQEIKMKSYFLLSKFIIKWKRQIQKISIVSAFLFISQVPFFSPQRSFYTVNAKRECCSLKGPIWLEQVVELPPMVKRKKKKKVYCSFVLKNNKKWYASLLKTVLISRP